MRNRTRSWNSCMVLGRDLSLNSSARWEGRVDRFNTNYSRTSTTWLQVTCFVTECSHFLIQASMEGVALPVECQDILVGGLAQYQVGRPCMSVFFKSPKDVQRKSSQSLDHLSPKKLNRIPLGRSRRQKQKKNPIFVPQVVLQNLVLSSFVNCSVVQNKDVPPA